MKHETEQMKSSRDNTCWHCDFDDVGLTQSERLSAFFSGVAFVAFIACLVYAAFA